MRNTVERLVLATLAFVVLLGAAPPGAPRVESVRAFAQGGGPGGAGTGGDLLATFGPLLLLIGLVVALIIAVGAALILVRTRGSTTAVSPEGWWTCSTCGAGNMDGAARCHACGTWRTTAQRPTPSASPPSASP